MKKNSLIIVLAVLAIFGFGLSGAQASGLIGSAQIQDQSIRSNDIGTNGVGSSEIRNGSVYPSDLNNSTKQLLKGQKGDTGPAGKDGTNGVDGKDGTNGEDGVSGYIVRSWDYEQVSGGGIATMTCPVGTVALGGGYWFKDDSAMTDGLSVVRSMPGRMNWDTNTPFEGDNRGWIIQPNKPANINPGALTVYVTCAKVAS